MAVILITGCSSGFGLATALAFARRGDRVWASMRDPGRAGELSARTAAEGLPVELVQLDVTYLHSVRAAVNKVRERDGRIDVLVNNAGMAHLGAVEMLPDPQVRAMFDTNLFGAVAMIRAVLPGMRAQRGGVIVNISSVAGRLPGTPGNWAYSASKHALSSLSDSLAEEVRPFGVRVVCLEPGFFRTGVIRENATTPAWSPYAGLEAQVSEYFRAGVAGGGDPAVVADAIVAAVADPDPPVHVIVGDEARRAVEASAALGDAKGRAVRRAALGLDPTDPGQP